MNCPTGITRTRESIELVSSLLLPVQPVAQGLRWQDVEAACLGFGEDRIVTQAVLRARRMILEQVPKSQDALQQKTVCLSDNYLSHQKWSRSCAATVDFDLSAEQLRPWL